MKNEAYCNLDPVSLEVFRKSERDINIKNKNHGNCEIPLTEMGLPEKNLCNQSFPFQVFEKANKKSADNACHPSFSSALQGMKTNKYCNYSKEELVIEETNRRNVFEASRKRGRCFAENKPHSSSEKYNRCPTNYNWFVSFENSVSLSGYCYNEASGAIEEMKNNTKCQ
jgi:hypothetical protein